MNEEEKARYFDKILAILKENKYRFGTETLSKKLDIGLHESNALCKILSDEYNVLKLTLTAQGDPPRYSVWQTQESRIFEDNHFTNLYNQKQAEKQKKEEFEKLQLTEIKRRLDAYENQSRFHETSIDKNKKQLELIESQIPYFKIAKNTSIAAIIVAIFSLIIAALPHLKWLLNYQMKN